jgi:hypothetical protein
MIRSNPTAIPLRASDLKHLQETIEKRQQAADQAASNVQTDPTQGASTSRNKDTQTQSGRPESQTHDAMQQRKKDRAAMSVNERIGI